MITGDSKFIVRFLGQMSRVLIVGVALASVSGCYYSIGRTLEPTAYLRKGHEPGSMVSVEVRGTTWPTGNIHMPFDFPVYEKDSIFEFRLPSLAAAVQAKDFELWTCGRRLEKYSGSIQPIGNGVRLDIKVPDPYGLEKPVEIHREFRLVATEEPIKPCESRKHYGPKRST